MGLGETILLYLVAGLAVAGAVYLSHDAARGWHGGIQFMTSTAFWPLYLPILLSRSEAPVDPGTAAERAAPDEMAEAIAQVDAELATALSSLDGWAENVLAREKSRLAELRSALAAHAARIREMDALFASVDGQRDELPVAGTDESLPLDRRAQSEQARRKNLRRLHEVRRRSYDDLMCTLAWIRELVSMIHLAKFTGAPASRAEELVAQIAAAVEGVSAVTWQDTDSNLECGDSSPLSFVAERPSRECPDSSATGPSPRRPELAKSVARHGSRRITVPVVQPSTGEAEQPAPAT